METLTDKLKVWRNELCDNVISKAEQVCNEWGISITKRIRKKRTMPGEYADDSALTVQQEMQRSLIEILNNLSVENSSRFSSIKDLEKRLWFLCKFEAYVNDGNIHFKEQLSQNNIKCIVDVYKRQGLFRTDKLILTEILYSEKHWLIVS